MRKINFIQLTLKGFKSHSETTVNFDEFTKIAGRNGAGKSSIAESITWLLYGTDPMGSKLEPTPHNTNEDTIVQLLLSVDDKQILLGRGIEKNKNDKLTNKFYINEVSKKATEFDALVADLFDKDLFLSIFIPNYFSSQHWEKQRKQLLQYVSEPTNKEILQELNEADRNLLTEGLTKYSIDDLESLNREKYNKLDKDVIRGQERVKVLKEQLEKAKTIQVDHVDPKEIAALESEIQAYQKKAKEIAELKNKRIVVAQQLDSLKSSIKRDKANLDGLKGKVIKEDCPTCGQRLKEEAIQTVHEHHAASIDQLTMTIRSAIDQFKEMQAELELMPEPQEIENIFEKQQRLAELKAKANNGPDLSGLEQEIVSAQEVVAQQIKNKNVAQSTVDAVKEFNNKKYELMAKKVSDLFNQISIKLFNIQKNGEVKATFEVEMDGKPYSKLSTAEKIKAGLEIAKVLSQQSGLIVPTFIDNKEVILSFEKPEGQLITATVIDCDFTVEGSAA